MKDTNIYMSYSLVEGTFLKNYEIIHIQQDDKKIIKKSLLALVCISCSKIKYWIEIPE